MPKLRCVVGLIAIAGCAVDDPLEQGLTIFTSDPQQGVTGMYARGELALFFETIREPEIMPAPQHDHFAADGSAINVSARFTDIEGRNLLVSIDAHLAPTGWSPPGEPSPAMLALRPALFELAIEAGHAIEATPFDPVVAAEQHALAITGIHLQPPAVVPPAPRSAVVASDGWDHWQYFEVHSAACCGIAEHSATVFWNWSESGGWEEGYQTSNHGRWATEMGLEDDCGGSGAWGGPGRPHFYGDNLQSCDMKSGYAVCGFWPFGNNHNCHDDSKLQRENIVYGAWYSEAPGYCGSSGCDMYAPHCY